MTNKEVKTVLNENITKSEKFRKLYDLGLTVAEISKLTSSVYSFVYGVIDRYSDGKIRQEKTTTKTDLFKNDYDLGLSIGEISKKHNSNYSWVHSTIKKYRSSKNYVSKRKDGK